MGVLIMSRVICAICHFEIDKKCIKKNMTVKLNKRRTCDMYEEDENKLRIINARKSDLPSSARPGWFWNRKEYVKEKKKQAAKEQMKKRIFSGDSEHPLTGNLDRFKSTVSKGRKGNR